ncbi:MAG: hypothetical protein KAT77_02130 [Nanoarchaeota archaeon]|nr:hypothetical protein [Nanoarchaeota archaeon]
MNKKRAAVPIDKMIVLLILVAFAVVFGIIMFDQLFPEASESVIESVISTVPGQADEIPETEVQIDANIEEAYDKFIEIIEENKEKGGPCFFQYNKLPNLGKNSIKLSDEGEFLTIVLNNDLGQQAKWRQITGLKLCVVAGKKDGEVVAQNFYENYLKDSLSRKNSNDYNEANEILIFKDEDNLGYKIVGAGLVEGQRENKQLLYVPEKGKICFLPTFGGWGSDWGCDADEEGLDNDCFDTADINKFMQKKC